MKLPFLILFNIYTIFGPKAHVEPEAIGRIMI